MPPTKPKKRRLVKGEDWDAWALVNKKTGKFTGWCGMRKLNKKYDFPSAKYKQVKVKLVEAKT